MTSQRSFKISASGLDDLVEGGFGGFSSSNTGVQDF